MPKTFMRGLELLEAIDLHGPLTVAELARRTGIEKSTVSRTLTACEPDGWIVRVDGRVALGPRAALLANSSSMAATVRQAEPLVQAISGVTGFIAQACALVGRSAVVIASAGSGVELPAGLGMSMPLFATAAGKTIAAQLQPSELGRLLPPEPFHDPLRTMADLPAYASLRASLAAAGTGPVGESVARTRRQLDDQLEQVRRDAVAIDAGEIHPELGCIAVIWPRASAPAALACLMPPAQLAAEQRLALAVLAAAAHPSATRGDIAAAAAGVTEAA